MAVKGLCHRWRGFMWDSERKAFMGRTGTSWLQIIWFYTVLYAFLAMFFGGTIQILLFSLSEEKPTYQDRLVSPGLTHTPHSEKHEISFNMNNKDTYVKYTDAIKDLLALYEEERQTPEMNYEDCGQEAGPSKDRPVEVEAMKACRFHKSWLDGCSGENDDNTFGFKSGKPCLIVKLNRVVKYTPAAPRGSPYKIPIHCTSKDEGKIRGIKYFGFEGGFPLQYYPYYGKPLHPQYLQPLVGIQFDIAKNEPIHLECRVFGEDIDYSDKDRYQGRFDVKLQVKDD